MISTILRADEITDISDELLMENGKIKLLPSDYYYQLKWENLRHFCHINARYGIPTVELIDCLKGIIDNRHAIEIGSGAGDLGFHLGIKMTDSKQQEDPLIKQAYDAMRQPVIQYPSDVEKIDALDAVFKYKPKVVVAIWITPYSKHETTFSSNPFGIKEDKILKLVETFIIIGNMDTHWDKPIRNQKHQIVAASWLISRAKNPENNCIFIWDKREDIKE